MTRTQFRQESIESVDATVVLNDDNLAVGKSVTMASFNPNSQSELGARGKLVRLNGDGTCEVRWQSGKAAGTVQQEQCDDLSRFTTRGVREEYWG